MSRPAGRGTIGDMNRSDIDDTVRDMWATRPPRRRTSRKIAGVAAALGLRYGIDPLLIRIAFVVTTIFGGVGILLYLLGWLLLPEEGDTASGAEALVGHGHSSMSKPLTIVLAIALIPATTATIFTERLSALLSLAAVAAGLFLLHKHRAGLAPPSVYAMAGHPAGAPVDAPLAASTGIQDTVPPSANGPDPGHATPPAWDPLGVAPFAWDLPEPTPVEPPAPPPAERRRRSPVTAVTLAVALMAAGAATILAMTTTAVGPREVAAFTLAVVGVGLVVGSFTRGGRGLIAVAIPLGLVTYALAVVPVDHFGAHGVGDRAWTASTAAELQPTYRLSAGNASLDLRDLRLADSDEVRTSVQLGTGELNILLPRDADVQVHCEASVGEVECLDTKVNGVNASTDRADGGDDGTGKGGTIVLNVSLGAGHAVVHRV